MKTSTGCEVILCKLIVFLQIHLLEDTSALKITLKHEDGTWCDEVVVPEMKLLNDGDEDDDHLVIEISQRKGEEAGSDITFYFSCDPKGRIHMPFTLRELQEKVKYSKIKMYHGDDLDLEVENGMIQKLPGPLS